MYRCGAACSNRRYHCQKQADFDLCPDCFGDGKFGAGMTTGDFIRMDASDAAVDADGGWTDQETLLLLEGLELFGEALTLVFENVMSPDLAVSLS
jgi:SWI/SNF related-matrix-associated actin-dependent regulator of chromatin subfamily C